MASTIQEQAEARVAAAVERYGSARAAYRALNVPFSPVLTASPEDREFDRALFAAMNGECWAAEAERDRSQAALAGAVAKIEAAFGKGSIVPASRMEAA